jgi:chromosome segregation ATPase
MAVGLLSGSAQAYAYNYHLDGDIKNLIAEGTALSRQYQSARQGMQEIKQKKQILDRTKHELAAQQSAYDKTAASHAKDIAAQKNNINGLKRQCNNEDSEENTPGHVNSCVNKIKTINVETKVIRSESQKLTTQEQALDSRTEDFNKQAAIWNHDQMLAISLFNNYSTRLNAWLNHAYAFMNTTDFQSNISWAHANKRCASSTPNNASDPEQELSDESRHALDCLRYVENARKAYYKKTP